MELVHLNNLDLQQGIKPGQVIRLVQNAGEPIQSTTVQSTGVVELEHVVQASDTVYSIARKYGVTIKELMEWNNKKDFALTVGEKLKVLKK
jgi:membrane-bound lytic murein transglycosylase D